MPGNLALLERWAGEPRIATVRPEPLPEWGIVGAAVGFANRGDFRSWMRLRQGTPWRVDADPDSPIARDLRDTCTAERDVLRQYLLAIINREVTQDLISLWRRRASSLVLTPHFSFAAGQLRVSYLHRAGELFDLPPNCAISYALLLLMDTKRTYGRDLCLCRFKSCGKFFFVVRPPRGRPQRKYCKREHMLLAHAANAAERVRRSRLNRKRAQTRRRS